MGITYIVLFLDVLFILKNRDFVGGVARKGKRRSGGSVWNDKLCKAINSFYQNISEGFTNKGYSWEAT